MGESTCKDGRKENCLQEFGKGKAKTQSRILFVRAIKAYR